MAANIFTGLTNSNWGTAGNWSLVLVPTASDGNIATFNATSPACIVNIAAVCNAIDFTGYTNSITMTNAITVSGNTTLVAAMGITGTGGLTINATATLTSNGKTWPNALTVNTAAQTFTFADSWIVTGLVFGLSGTKNGSTLLANGGVISWGGGTTVLTIGGGTCTGSFNGTVNVNGSTNVALNSITITGGTFTYLGGRYSVSGTTTLTGGNIDTQYMKWGEITSPTGDPTVTFTSPFNSLAYQRTGFSGNNPIFNGSQWNCDGNFGGVGGNTNASINGTTVINMIRANSFFQHLAGNPGQPIANPVRIDSPGLVTFIHPSLQGGGFTNNFEFVRGSCAFISTTLTIPSGVTLIGWHKMKSNLKIIRLVSGTTTTMDGFFQGTQAQQLTVQSSSTTVNATVTFNDGLNKIARYVKLVNITLDSTQPARLRVLNMNGNGGKNIGMLFGDRMPRSFSNPTVQKNNMNGLMPKSSVGGWSL